MGIKGSGDSFPSVHLVERQMLLARVRDHSEPSGSVQEPTELYRFITVARDIGARGDEVAASLADHLHGRVFDKEIVDSIARDTHVRQDLVHELDERSQSLIHDMVERLLLMAEGISFGMSVEEIVAAVQGLMQSTRCLQHASEPSRQDAAFPGSSVPAWGISPPEER
jgi:hypothetical protein